MIINDNHNIIYIWVTIEVDYNEYARNKENITVCSENHYKTCLTHLANMYKTNCFYKTQIKTAMEISKMYKMYNRTYTVIKTNHAMKQI